MDGPLFIMPQMCYNKVSHLKEDNMSISLAGPTQAQTDCIHHWDIVGMHDDNPTSGKHYGVNTPGTCRNCGTTRMFFSGTTDIRREDFKVGSA